MSLLKSFALVLSIMLVSMKAWSQEAELCNAALSSGIRDNYYVFTERVQYEQYQDRLCDANFSSYDSFAQDASRFGLDLPVAEGVIGLAGDDQRKSQTFLVKYRKYCESSYFDSTYKDRFMAKSNRINSALTNSWLECHRAHVESWSKANAYGLSISITPQDGFSEFTLHVERRTKISGPIIITDITPAGAINCSRGGIRFQPEISIDRREFLFSCDKSPDRSVQVALDTSDGFSNTVLVPSQTRRISELSNRISSVNSNLVSEIASLRSEVERLLNVKIANLEFWSGCNSTEGGNICKIKPPSCPEGFLRAHDWWDSWPGGSCGNGSKCRVCVRLSR